jgi:hypothetical protein
MQHVQVRSQEGGTRYSSFFRLQWRLTASSKTITSIMGGLSLFLPLHHRPEIGRIPARSVVVQGVVLRLLKT